jgi:hypothetical protein
MMKFFTNNGAAINSASTTIEAMVPNAMYFFGTASTAGASVTISCNALMIRLASRRHGRTGHWV